MPTLRLTTTSNIAVSIRAEVRTETGVARIPTTVLSVGAGTLESGQTVRGGGERLPIETPMILDALVETSVLAVARGQVYAQLGLFEGDELKRIICRGYVYTGKPLMEGENVEPGPAGGHGYLRWVTVFHNRAGNAAALDYALSATNALRKIYGVTGYYHSDGNVATRTHPMPKLLGLGGTKPTGFTLTGDNAFFDNLGGGDNTLTANEEGAHIAVSMNGKDGRRVSVDNGTVTIANAGTNPSPFPLTITEDDTDSIIRFPANTNGLAGDTHSAYVLMEEWALP